MDCAPTHTPGVNRMCQHGASPVVALAAAPAAPAAHTSQQRQRDNRGQWAAMHRTPREGQNIVQGLVLPIVPHCPAPLSDIVQTLSRTVRYCPELCGIVVLAGGPSRTGDTAARAAVPKRRWQRRRRSARSSRGHRSCAACVARDSGGIFACLRCGTSRARVSGAGTAVDCELWAAPDLASSRCGTHIAWCGV